MFFLTKSFGILALLAALFALLSCRGTWLQDYPTWFVAVPAGVSLLLAALGVFLLWLPAARASSPLGILFAMGFVVLAAFGGTILTHYYHGDSDADRSGSAELSSVVDKLGPRAGILAAIVVVALLIQQFKNKSKEK